MKMGKKAVTITLPALVAGVCATAIGQYQSEGIAEREAPQPFQTPSSGKQITPLLSKRVKKDRRKGLQTPRTRRIIPVETP